MARRNSCCGICESVNHAAACSNCINSRLTDKYKVLSRLSQQRDSSRRRLDVQLVAKREAESQRHWRAEHVERKAKLREQLRIATIELREANSRGEQEQRQLDAQTTSLAVASSELATREVELLGKYYPDLIRGCNADLSAISTELFQNRRMIIQQLCNILPLRHVGSPSNEQENWEVSEATQPLCLCGVQLPAGDDFASVSPLDLAASLGYMVQLVNLTARYLSAPLLHSQAGFAASSSRIWQRVSYFDPRPAARSEEFPLFLPRECTTVAEETRELGRRSSRSSNNDMDRSRGNVLDSSIHSPRSSSSHGSLPETHKELQRGIKLLKRSIACVNAYGHVLLSFPVPSDMSTFEAFSDLLATLVSKEPYGRSGRGSQQSNDRFGLSQGLHSKHLGSCAPNMLEDVQPASSSLDCSKMSFKGIVRSWDDLLVAGTYSEQLVGRPLENLFDGWDLVEHPRLPPPPSHSDDVEHWTRAMFIDATK